MIDLFLPEDIIKLIPKSLKKVGKNFSWSKKLLAALIAIGVNDTDAEDSLDRVSTFYKNKAKLLKMDGEKNADKLAINDNKLISQRVDNLVAWTEAQRMKEKHRGEVYVWLPSSSKEPRPLHQAKYGQTFVVGKDVFPGEEYGCRCGALFLDGEELTLENLPNLAVKTKAARKRAIEEIEKEFDN